MNILKSLLSGLVVLSTCCKQNEIVIPRLLNSLFVKSLIMNIRFVNWKAITISWDMNNEQSKHFSIERYIEGDINDAFIISKNKHEQGGFEWWTLILKDGRILMNIGLNLEWVYDPIFFNIIYTQVFVNNLYTQIIFYSQIKPNDLFLEILFY